MVKIVLMSVPSYVLKNRIRLDDRLVCAQWEQREFTDHKTKGKEDTRCVVYVKMWINAILLLGEAWGLGF